MDVSNRIRKKFGKNCQNKNTEVQFNLVICGKFFFFLRKVQHYNKCIIAQTAHVQRLIYSEYRGYVRYYWSPAISPTITKPFRLD